MRAVPVRHCAKCFVCTAVFLRDALLFFSTSQQFFGMVLFAKGNTIPKGDIIMRSRKREAVFMGLGILAGLALSGPAAQAADYLTARPSSQTFYINGQQAALTAYAIGGSNYVRLRDIGKAVDFGVTYDATTNSVYIDSTQPYREDTTATPPDPTEESVQAILAQLRETYPTGTEFPTPYRSTSGGPYHRGTHCSGWATLCSDAAFGSLPWRRVDNPSWEQIRSGDLIRYDNSSNGHVVVVVKKTDEYIKVTESGLNNRVRWGGQYFKWWLEAQPGYTLYTRYPE